ncbi:PilN domain-containing protein [Photobacterium arenosum]|uniref:PilN domain-containing protein n=1 Tax=Photobacterium arenosum TaxID=2774143 RepID=UPI00288B132B|nr:PilN domain-containing protein [Photobacterium arenosum]
MAQLDGGGCAAGYRLGQSGGFGGQRGADMLIPVNLLPWREAQRIAHARRFWYCLAATVVLAVLSMGSLRFYYGERTARQTSSNDRIQQQILALAPDLAKLADYQRQHQMYQSRLAAVSRWHHARFPLIHLLNHLPDLLPLSAGLERLTLKGNAIVLAGQTRQLAALPDFLARIERQEWVSRSQLHSVQRDNSAGSGEPLTAGDGAFQRFSVTMTLVSPLLGDVHD